MENVLALIDYARQVEGFDLGSAAMMQADEVQAAYNGCGPERWHEVYRDIADYFTGFYAAAVMVHDCDFTNSDGTEEMLDAATSRFRANTSAIIKREYPLWTWQMLRPTYRVKRAQALALKEIMDLGVSPRFCRQAWQEAFEARKKKEA